MAKKIYEQVLCSINKYNGVLFQMNNNVHPTMCLLKGIGCVVLYCIVRVVWIVWVVWVVLSGIGLYWVVVYSVSSLNGNLHRLYVIRRRQARVMGREGGREEGRKRAR